MRVPTTFRRALVGSGVVLATVAVAAGVQATRPSPGPDRQHPVVTPPSPGEQPNGRTARGPAQPPVQPPGRPPALAPRPNVLVVMLDDMRSDEIRFAPNARRYVRDRGLDFRNSFSPYPLCCPARASFLLGRYAHNHGVLHHDPPYGFGSLDDRVTIAGRLQEAGYLTGFVGKYLNRYGEQPSRVTGKASFDYVPAGWTDWMAGLETPWPVGSPYAGNTYDYENFTQNVNGRVVPHPGQYSSTVIADQVRSLIGRYHRAQQPFFLWVNPVAPHHGLPVEPDDPPPYRQAQGYLQEYLTPARPDWVKGRFDDQITHAFGQPEHGPAEADVSDKPHNISKWLEATPTERLRLRDVTRQRAESIYAWDVEFGRILQRLESTGEYDDTVIVFTSDNGYYLGEHRQRLGKIKAHEPVLHVPLVVAGPGIERGVRYHPITTMDLTATILELAGARDLPAMDGASQLDLMRGPDRPWTVPVLTEGLVLGGGRPARAGMPPGLTTSGIRTGRYKLIRYATGEAELYDLLSDPNELDSVWSDPAHRAVRLELMQLWKQYRSCRGAGCRVPLPPGLQQDPEQLEEQHEHARQEQRSYYGR